MVWCSTCSLDVDPEHDGGVSCCAYCGRVLEEAHFANDVQFAKGPDGEGGVVGQFVGEDGEARGLARFSGGKMWVGASDSHQGAANRGRQEIADLVHHFHISPTNDTIEAAHRLYKLALQHGFTRGRRTNQVAANCVYIVCRQETKPFMLIDFADQLSINVFTLGGVFLQLVKLFRLENFPAFTRPVDPSLFLHRFVDRLKFGDKTQAVLNTAMRLVQSMKRDWMQTGRRPSGICGAAIFIAAHIHGFERTKHDIISVVHIGWSTIERRVEEFAQTLNGDMTLKDFEEKAKSVEQEHFLLMADMEKRHQAELALPAPSEAEGTTGREVVPAKPADNVGCEHMVHAGATPFAYNLCRDCFVEYLTSSGGIFQGSSDPPCYTAGLRKELRKKVLALSAVADQDVALLTDGTTDDPDLVELDAALDSNELQPLTSALGHRTTARTLAAAKAAMVAKSRGDKAGDGAGPSNREAAPELGGQDPAKPGCEAHAADSPRLAGASGDAAGAAGSGADAGKAGGSAEAPALPASQVPTQQLDAGPGTCAEEQTQRYGPITQPDPTQPSEDLRPAAGTSTNADEQTQDAAGTPALTATQPAASSEAPEPSRKRSREEESEAGDQGPRDPEDLNEASALSTKEGEGDTGEIGPGAIVAVNAAEEEDNLSDIDDEELQTYIASKEEAQAKGEIWEEMNKDWLEKQALKEAAMAAEALNPKPKVKRTHRKKDAIAAESAEDAAKSMLEQKKLSNKINYSILEDLFSPALEHQARAGGSVTEAPPSAAGSAAAEAAARLAAEFGAERPEQQVTAALKRRAAQRAAEQAQAQNKYSKALQEEQNKRGPGLGGGGFLGSLSFAKESNGLGRSRPMGLGGLGPKPRGK